MAVVDQRRDHYKVLLLQLAPDCAPFLQGFVVEELCRKMLVTRLASLEKIFEWEPGMEKEEGLPDLSSIPPKYRPIIRNPRFRPYLHLLGDEKLGMLMHIEYPDTDALGAVLTNTASARLVRIAIARQFGMEPNDVERGHYEKLEELSLGGSDFSDCTALSGLSARVAFCGFWVLGLWPRRG